MPRFAMRFSFPRPPRVGPIVVAAALVLAPAPAAVADMRTMLHERAAYRTPTVHGRASYYASALAGRKTASGERYRPDAMTAAHRTLPLGTKVRVVDRHTKRAVVVRINDRGPYVGGRTIDVSRRAARLLGMTDRGVADVDIEVVALPG